MNAAAMPIMPTTHLLYLHGFRSSPQSGKARTLAATVTRHQPGVTWLSPTLPASPQQALDQLQRALADWPKASMAVVGSSLGGFYATWLAEHLGCRAVLLNPAVQPARDLAAYVGDNTLWHEPQTHFIFEPRFIDQLRACQIARISRPERYFAVIAQGDELLDWREMVAHYAGARIKLLPGSDHVLSDFDQHLDDILDFLQLR